MIVLASGFFDPLHIGHLDYLQKAKALGDRLIVLVNTDQAAVRKKGYYFYTQDDRVRLVAALKWVDEVQVANDNDDTIAASLFEIKPDIFAKGGDWSLSNLPEKEIDVCKKLNIQIVTGLGEKIASSSENVRNAATRFTDYRRNNT